MNLFLSHRHRPSPSLWCVLLASGVLGLGILHAADRPYLGWIPIQTVEAGKEFTLDLRRFFEAGPGGRLDVPTSGKDWEASLNESAFQLRVTPASGAKGLIDIPLRVVAEGAKKNAPPLAEAVLTLAVSAPAGHTFVYEDRTGKASKVTLAGVFNGWNTDSHPLKSNGSGKFELTVPLPAGDHPYKFLVDGVWTPDPANSETEPGSDNSLLRLKEGTAPGAAASVYAESQGRDNVVFRVPDGSLPRVSAVLQLPNGSSQVIQTEATGGRVKISTASFPDRSWLRLAVVDDKGRVSPPARVQIRPDGSFQWQDAVIYYAFTDRFVNGDPSNDRPVKNPDVLPQANYYGGDFAGIRQKVEEGYFEKIGANVLWLAPLNRNPDGAWKSYKAPQRTYTGYHGYWPVSSTDVEPRFGGEKELTALVESTHKKKGKIIADLVLKHAHIEHPLWKEHRDWFGTLELPDGRKNLRIWDEHQFTTWFEEWLPGFNFENEQAVRYLIDNAVAWAEKYQLDGYRLDAVKHIQYSFWWKFRAALRDRVQARRSAPMYFVGETFMDRRGIMSFVGPNMLDGQFDFPLYDTLMEVFATGKMDFAELEKSLAASEVIYGKETLMSTLVGNHDKSRFMAFADGDLPDAEIKDEEEVGWNKPPQVDHRSSYEKLKMALAFIMAIDGAPMVYYGDEVGMTGAGDPDNRRMMPLEKDLSSDQKSVRDFFSRATAARRMHPALRYGSRRALVADGDRYAFVRRHLDDVVLAAWNRGEAASAFELPAGPEMADGTYTDAFSKNTLEVRNGTARFNLDAGRAAYFTKP
ncbi:MAG: alpha-amylase family glycosyl hydrolase [Candidatus Methylacidiphilales bacterium]|nr:alpha-amylase family glycosyl hydrolase [Candidatus Methylacidiphilales bacterium]